MSPEFYRNLTKSFGFLAFGVLFSVIAFASLVEIKDLDLWLHIKMGEIITSTGNVPAQDVLSGTIAGKPWVNHEWLFQTIVYSVKAVFGMDGLLYMQAALVVLTFLLLLLWTYRGDRQLVILPLLFFVFQVYQTRFTVRPDIFSVLYFILFLMVLFTSMEKRWSLFALMALEILWTNMHGYFFWGPALVGVFILAETVRRVAPLPAGWKEGLLSDEAYRRTLIALVLVLACTIANPLMLEGALYPFRVMFSLSGDNRIFFKFITELQPSVEWPKFFEFSSQAQFKTLIIVSAISFLLNIRRVHVGWLLVWAVVLVFAAAAVRNMIYFAVVAYLATLFNIAHLDLRRFLPVRFIAGPFEHVTGWLAKIAFIVFLLNCGGDMAQYGYYDFNKYERKSEFLGVAQRMFPSGAVDFLLEEHITGPVFNDFNTGAYLVGRAYPGIRVFIDGRTEVYGAKFFEVYRKIWEEGDAQTFDEAAAQYDLKAVVIGAAYSRPPAGIMKQLIKRTDWRLVYFGHDGLVFLRDIPAHKDIIRRRAIDLKKWAPPVSDVRRLGSARVAPYRETNRAVMLMDMGFDDQALAEADAALAVAPENLDAYKVKALVHEKRKDHARAFTNFRLALLQSTGDVRLRRGMALALVNLGDHERALEQADRLDEAAGDPAGPFIRACVLVKKKQYEKAYDILVQQVFKAGHASRDLVAAGDLYMEEKAYAWAAKAYALALRKDIKDQDLVKKLKEAKERLAQ